MKLFEVLHMFYIIKLPLCLGIELETVKQTTSSALKLAILHTWIKLLI